MLLHGKSEIIALLSRLPAINFPVVPKLCLGMRQCRSGVEPPTGTIHPRKISARNSKPEKNIPEMNLLIDYCFPFVVPLPSRGWIVPVGGSTPDRLKVGCLFVVAVRFRGGEGLGEAPNRSGVVVRN